MLDELDGIAVGDVWEASEGRMGRMDVVRERVLEAGSARGGWKVWSSLVSAWLEDAESQLEAWTLHSTTLPYTGPKIKATFSRLWTRYCRRRNIQPLLVHMIHQCRQGLSDVRHRLATYMEQVLAANPQGWAPGKPRSLREEKYTLASFDVSRIGMSINSSFEMKRDLVSCWR